MKILVCVDFSAAAAPVLDLASRYARAFGAEVVLAHAAAPEPTFMGYDEPGRGPLPVDLRADELGDEREQMQRWADDLGAAGVRVAAPVLRIGPTVATLLAIADEFDVELVVLARRSHGFLHHLVLGSTADSLVRESRRPVLLVPVDRSSGTGG